MAVQLHDPRKADRVEAANFLGIDKVSTIRLEDLTEAEIRVYIIADNRLAEKVGSEPCRQTRHPLHETRHAKPALGGARLVATSMGRQPKQAAIFEKSHWPLPVANGSGHGSNGKRTRQEFVSGPVPPK